MQITINEIIIVYNGTKRGDLINKNALLNLTHGNPNSNLQFRPRKEKHTSNNKLKDYLKKTCNSCKIDPLGNHFHSFSCVR